MLMVPGFVSKSRLAEWKHPPAYLPHFQFYEKHHAVIHTSYPERILPTVAGFDIQKDAVVRTLMSVRQIPLKLRRRVSDHIITPFGLHSFTLLESTTTELCYGLRGQFWRADFGLESVPDVQAYCAPLQPGNAKLLLRYQVRHLHDDEYELRTETYIYCPDKKTTLKMAAYWLAIRIGSGWIRLRTLKAVKRELGKRS